MIERAEPNRDALTPEMRVRALLYFFGWNGGTIHQLSEATGLSPCTLLYAEMKTGQRLSCGFSAVRTCEKEWRVERLAPRERGNWSFWADAIFGFWATGPLDSKRGA